MIVKMKKITVVTQSKDIDTALKALARAGVLHIEHQRAPLSEDVSRLEERYNVVSRAIEVLPDKQDTKAIIDDVDSLAHKIIELNDEKEVLLESLKKADRDIAVWEEWGDFDPEIIDDLKDRNLWIRLCAITKKDIKNIPEGVIL